MAGSNPRGRRNTPRHRSPLTGTNRVSTHAPNPAAPSPELSHVKVQPAPSSFHFVIPSDFNDGRDVQKQILDDIARRQYSEHSTFAIKLALEEALINAIKHGNNFDPAKHVVVDVLITTESAEIQIEDQGPGFDRANVPDPTAEENLDKCSGRGILLMEAYMNIVEWSHDGRRIRLVKRNEEDLVPK